MTTYRFTITLPNGMTGFTYKDATTLEEAQARLLLGPNARVFAVDVIR